MKYENINEKTVKISLTFQDLADHDVKLTDFMGNQHVIEELFYDIVEELGIEDRFQNSGLMTFQVQPHPKGVDLMVIEEEIDMNQLQEATTPDEMEELLGDFFEKIGKGMPKNYGMANEDGEVDSNPRRKLKEIPDFIYYSVKFERFEDLMSAVKNVRISAEESELYLYDTAYYLVILDNQKAKGAMNVETYRARMMDYGEETRDVREILQEYGQVLIPTQAMKVLAEI